MTWHEPDQHDPAPLPPEVLTGQVPVEPTMDSSCIAHVPVSGNWPCPDCGAEAPPYVGCILR